ncbi:MAG: GntR family transcriptional regulator [Pseudomonadales bacterium]
MHFRPPYRAAGDRVYQAIKARLVAYEFPQGRRIYLEPLAESLGVSTTPVREAMNRLAERDLVVKAENKGFFAMTLTEARLRGSYDLTRQLLTLGLENLSPAAASAMATYAPAADLVNKLNRRDIADAGTLARYTGDVLSAIATIIENSAVEQSIDLANDHLYFVRMLECRHIPDIQSELKRFCELLLSGERDELVAAIVSYHKERLEILPHLLHDRTR